MTNPKQDKDLEINTQIARNVADYIYKRCEQKAVEVICATGLRENKAVRLIKIAEICQVSRPHLAAVGASFDEACKEESQQAAEMRGQNIDRITFDELSEPKQLGAVSELTAKELVQKLRKKCQESIYIKTAGQLLDYAESLLTTPPEQKDNEILVSTILDTKNQEIAELKRKLAEVEQREKEAFDAGREGLDFEGVRHDGTYCEWNNPSAVDGKFSFKYFEYEDYKKEKEAE